MFHDSTISTIDIFTMLKGQLGQLSFEQCGKTAVYNDCFVQIGKDEPGYCKWIMGEIMGEIMGNELSWLISLNCICSDCYWGVAAGRGARGVERWTRLSSHYFPPRNEENIAGAFLCLCACDCTFVEKCTEYLWERRQFFIQTNDILLPHYRIHRRHSERESRHPSGSRISVVAGNITRAFSQHYHVAHTK